MARFAVTAAVLVAFATSLSGPAPARPACHPIGPHVLARGNLDADRAVETLAELEGPVDCAHSAFVAEMQLTDTCRGRALRYPVSAAYRRPDERLDRGTIVEADGLRGRREAFFVVHGATSDTGEAAVVHLVAGRRGVCPRPRSLFRYQPGLGVHEFKVELVDLFTRFQGLEIRVTEHTGVSGDDIGVRLFRFDRARGKYVPCC
jgi:hypothetical protein